MAWQDDLRAASFRGIQFYVKTHSYKGGRRAVQHEYPGRDVPYAEDMGRKGRAYDLKAYVLGDNYMIARDDLVYACEQRGSVGTLIHPYLGNLQVRCGAIGFTETDEEGGYAAFDLIFYESGSQSPIADFDSTGAIIAALKSFIKVLKQTYGQIMAIVADPSILIGMAGNLALGVTSDLTGLPASVLSSCANAVTGIVSPLVTGTNASGVTVIASTDPSALTDAVTAAFSTIADQILAANQSAPTTGDAISGIYASAGSAPTSDAITGTTATTLLPGQDPASNLAAFAAWAATIGLPFAVPNSTAAATQSAAVAGFQNLVNDAAALYTVAVYAQSNFATAQDAQTAQTNVLAMLDARVTAAANNGYDDLYRAWRAISAFATINLINEAQNLPNLATYTVPAIIPAPVLAQRFDASGAGADALAALNGVWHPGFMPVTGQRLVS